MTYCCPRAFRPVLFLALVVLLTACHTAVPPQSARKAPPAYTEATQHYRAFATLAEVAAYLDLEAGPPLISAHRGGPEPGYPENAIATFARSLRYGPVLLETDVRMSRDSVLVLLHDDTLDRTTTGTGALSEQSLAQLRTLLLKDNRGVVTPFGMPTLDEALAWARGRALLTLDIKRGVPPKHVVDAIARLDAATTALVIVYSFDDLVTYYALNPDLLFSVTVRSVADVEQLLALNIPPGQMIAFTGVGEVKPAVIERLREAGIRPMMGTFGRMDERAREAGPEVYHALFDQGLRAIATDNVSGAMQATRSYTR